MSKSKTSAKLIILLKNGKIKDGTNCLKQASMSKSGLKIQASKEPIFNSFMIRRRISRQPSSLKLKDRLIKPTSFMDTTTNSRPLLDGTKGWEPTSQSSIPMQRTLRNSMVEEGQMMDILLMDQFSPLRLCKIKALLHLVIFT